KPVITLFNKIDKYMELEEKPKLFDEKADKVIKISAKHDIGFEEIKNALEEILRENHVYVQQTFGFNDAGKIQQIRKYGQLLKEEYTADGIYIEAYVPREVYGRIM
ncbi:MAG: GTPase HflX, partial [Lachnospiraceae bacterium]